MVNVNDACIYHTYRYRKLNVIKLKLSITKHVYQSLHSMLFRLLPGWKVGRGEGDFYPSKES